MCPVAQLTMMGWCRRYPKLRPKRATRHHMVCASGVILATAMQKKTSSEYREDTRTQHRTPPTEAPPTDPLRVSSFFFGMDDQPVTATGAATAESPAQKQARLRRERRAAKLADGENRLQAITALQGGTHRDVKKDLPGMSAFLSVAICPLKWTCKLTATQSSPPPHRRYLPQRSQGLPHPILKMLISVNIITCLPSSHVFHRPSPLMQTRLRSSVRGRVRHPMARTPCSKCCNN